MRYTVLHASPKRVRIQILQLRMTDSQAEQLEEYLFSFANVDKVRADERTGNVTLHFTGDCESVLSALSEFAYDRSREHEPCSHGRMLIREFEQDLLAHISRRVMRWLLIPDFLKPVMAGVQAIPYVLTALKTLACGKLDVTVLDGASVTVSLLAGDHDTSSTIMFLLGLSEILEDYTHRKSGAPQMHMVA